MGAMSFRRLPAAAAQRAARLLPGPAGAAEAQIRQAAWVARCVGRGHPAWVIRQPFTFVRANAGAEALSPGLTQLYADQLIDL